MESSAGVSASARRPSRIQRRLDVVVPGGTLWSSRMAVRPIASEMMHAQRRERAVMGVMAIDRRLAEEAEVQRKRMQRGDRHRACGIEHCRAMVGGRGQIGWL